ncbi:ribonuclease P protein component [Patescibacteria group bacterium]|nr:ribonuclease P protein component [Patescibacteria group bacterium]
MLPKENRINKELFKKVFEKGKTIKRKSFFIKEFFVNKKEKRFSFVVPSSVTKSAVKKNKLKRWGKFIINTQKNEIMDGLFLIFVFDKKAVNIKFGELKEDITSALGKYKKLDYKCNKNKELKRTD